MTYNAIWFAVPILALVVCITKPAAARDAEQWAGAHSRSILLSVSFIAGAALVVRGALTL